MSGSSQITSAGLFAGRKPAGRASRVDTAQSRSEVSAPPSSYHEDLAQSDALEESFAHQGRPSYADVTFDPAIEESFPAPVCADLSQSELDAVEESFASEGRPSYIDSADDQAIDESFAGYQSRRRT